MNKLVIVGVGLIGGSLALALKRKGQAKIVVGVGRGAANLAQAKRRRIIDRGYTLTENWTAELIDADLVFIATPVGEMRGVLAALADAIGPATLISDGGSTKQEVIAAAREVLGERIACFVPGHPIAGSEKSGAHAATHDLYRDKRVILTPLAENSVQALALVRTMWETVGAEVTELDALSHDRILAAVSHLPHVLAFALLDLCARRPDRAELFRFAGDGFRDFTRIGGSSPEMWRDICIANREAVIDDLSSFQAELQHIVELLRAKNADGLGVVFERARAAWTAQRADRI